MILLLAIVWYCESDTHTAIGLLRIHALAVIMHWHFRERGRGRRRTTCGASGIITALHIGMRIFHLLVLRWLWRRLRRLCVTSEVSRWARCDRRGRLSRLLLQIGDRSRPSGRRSDRWWLLISLLLILCIIWWCEGVGSSLQNKRTISETIMSELKWQYQKTIHR